MFGLTKREQYWAAQERGAELMVKLAIAKLASDERIEIVRLQAKQAEIEALRAEATPTTPGDQL